MMKKVVKKELEKINIQNMRILKSLSNESKKLKKLKDEFYYINEYDKLKKDYDILKKNYAN